MAEIWGLPEVCRWWLRDDEGCPPIVRSIRTFMEDRSLHPRGQAKSEDVRNMKALLSDLSIDEDA